MGKQILVPSPLVQDSHHGLSHASDRAGLARTEVTSNVVLGRNRTSCSSGKREMSAMDLALALERKKSVGSGHLRQGGGGSSVAVGE